MGKVGYWECPTGIAGDMCLGALVDLGVPWDYLCDRLDSLGIAAEFQLECKPVKRNGQLATKVHVNLTQEHHHHGRHLPQIETIITAADISDRAKQWSLQVFRNLAIAEGAVHGIAPEKVHFHEVGATDAIVDIVGTCVGLDWLKIDKLYCSPLPTGGGTIRAAHGKLPVPVPATLKLWESRQVPVYSNGIAKELVTPTGAAIVTTLATSFGDLPAMTVEKIGLGAGSRDLAIPNILRLWLGTARDNNTDTSRAVNRLQRETITVLETQIDDLTPQAIAYTSEQLIEAGALDVFTQAVGMKKSRTGILLTVICYPELAATCKTIIFCETTTLGIRETTQQRSILNREIETVNTEYGAIRIKIASWGEGDEQEIVNIHPEYEDCAAIARKHAIPWREIHYKAIAAWQNRQNNF